MRNKNGRFAKKISEEDTEIEAIREYEYTDLWIYKVIDGFMRALLGLLLRLGIQVFFLLLFAIFLKKIGLLEIIKEIMTMVFDIFNFAKGKSDSKNEIDPNGAGKSSYFT